ncbi:hypothetical protein D3C72_2034680 [compost metagenome]
MDAQRADVLKCQPQPIEDDAQAQQFLFGKTNASIGGCLYPAIDGVADQHADHDGDRECGQALAAEPGQGCEVAGNPGDGSTQQQAGNQLFAGR